MKLRDRSDEDSERARERRAVLRKLGTAAAGAAAIALLRTESVSAGHDETNVFHLGTGVGTPNQTGGVTTALEGSLADPALAVTNDSGPAIFAQNTGTGNALVAQRGGSGVGTSALVANSSTAAGAAIFADRNGAGSGNAIDAVREGTGSGAAVAASNGTSVQGDALSAFRTGSGFGHAIQAQNHGTGGGSAILAERIGTGTVVLAVAKDGAIGVVTQNAQANGLALLVSGVAQFDGPVWLAKSGSGNIAAGASSAAVLQDAITAKSHVAVQLTSDPGKKAVVQWVERTAGTGFVIRLTDRVDRATTFTYAVFETP